MLHPGIGRRRWPSPARARACPATLSRTGQTWSSEPAEATTRPVRLTTRRLGHEITVPRKSEALKAGGAVGKQGAPEKSGPCAGAAPVGGGGSSRLGEPAREASPCARPLTPRTRSTRAAADSFNGATFCRGSFLFEPSAGELDSSMQKTGIRQQAARAIPDAMVFKNVYR